VPHCVIIILVQDYSLTGRFHDRTFPWHMSNELIRQGLAKKLKLQVLMLNHYPGHWSCSLNYLATEYKSLSWRAGKRAIVVLPIMQVLSQRMAPSFQKCSYAAAFLRVCVCVWHLRLLAECSTETIFDHTDTVKIKLNTETSHHTGICLNSCRLRCTCWKP